ncbi:hypothetical protein [Enterovirga rhinocerotis]|uniref:hypothetical protein n=1 Tax=Enterovirga rhinocerotis TaxID=1339210 RepID=UPI00105D72A6|nr:hypothetical protein [Enterovirga rhinocerotis]
MAETPSPDQAALLALAELRERLRTVEDEREARIAAGMTDADASLESAVITLDAVSRFCRGQSMVTRSIDGVLFDLAAVSQGWRHSGMLSSRRARQRPSDHPLIEILKGYLAAIMEHLQRKGFPRPEASAWTQRNIPQPIAKVLRNPAAKTIDSWLGAWSDEYASPSAGRYGYLFMRETLLANDPSVSDLPARMKALVSYLPPSQESG